MQPHLVVVLLHAQPPPPSRLLHCRARCYASSKLLCSVACWSLHSAAIFLPFTFSIAAVISPGSTISIERLAKGGPIDDTAQGGLIHDIAEGGPLLLSTNRRQIIMTPKGRGGRMVRNTHIDQSQLSSRMPGQQNDNNDEPHLTQLNEGSASQPSPQALSQPSPQLDGVNSSDGSVLDAEDNELPNVGQSSAHTETRGNRKLVIAVEKGDNPKRFTNHTVTRDITKDLLSRMPSPAPRWQDYCPNMKDELFKGFLEKHEFASNYDKAMARTVWNRTMLDRYPDILKRARERAFKEANSTSIADIKGHGPKAMKVDVWNGLVDHWLDSKWKNRSVAGQKNRAAMPAHKLHTAGSISFGEHKRRKEAKLKRRVSFLEVYDDVHKKKSGEYVSEVSKEIIDLYGEAISQKYGEDLLDQPEVDPDVWTEVAGTNKKGRVHGLGRSLDIGIRDHRDVPLPEDTSVSTVKPVSQADITQAIKEALPSAINEVLPSVVNEAIQSNLLSLLSKIPGFPQEKDH
ncbi:uncharacterized protein [Arachis hypogaea]|uniref:uncharacterized protein isoform X2 n=1 Tax=Arachis hypogaea TaxID=3818 RepID=UPI000DEC46AB|nr:uncharacterized protein LOC112741989 isoform X2 [Arachis hypogaea]